MLKNIWRILTLNSLHLVQKEENCNIIYLRHRHSFLQQRAWLVKGYQLGCHPLYNEQKKLELWVTKIRNHFRTHLLGNILSSVYIKKQVCRWRGKLWELQDVRDLLSKCWRAEENNCITGSKKDKWKRKNANFVASGNHSPWGAHDGQNYL